MANHRHCLRLPSLLSFLEFLQFLDILGRQSSLCLPNLQGNSGVHGLLLSRRVSSYLHPELYLFAIFENSTLRRDCDLLRQVSLYLTYLFDRVLRVSPGFSTQSDCSVEELVETETDRLIVVGFDFATILVSFLLSHPFRHRSGAASQPEILSTTERADVKQIKKIVPPTACESPFCQYVCKLVLGVDILDLNLEFQINSVKQPIKSNSVGSGYVSHCWASSLYDHLDHCFVVFTSVKLRLALRRICVRGDVVHMRQLINVSVSLLFGFGFAISQAVSCCPMGW